ncbi:MAG TPA: heme exporter protein CcmD [Actinomycetota bacterium]|jgi:CcmD family protein|nr:heme exporter protein CcmD [Actinomycetota bacterium]
MDGLGFLGLAYLLVFAAIVMFLFSVSRRQRALEKRIDELRASEKKGAAK